jgi:hypothetical protein
LITIPQMALTPAVKARWGTRFEALGVDLETAAVAEAAMEARLPWLAVRAVLDSMEQFLFAPGVLWRGIRAAGKPLADCLTRMMTVLGSGKTIQEETNGS